MMYGLMSVEVKEDLKRQCEKLIIIQLMQPPCMYESCRFSPNFAVIILVYEAQCVKTFLIGKDSIGLRWIT